MTENFLPKELIDADLVRFSKGLESYISESTIEVYEDQDGNVAKMGFSISLPRLGRNYKVYMLYDVNQWGEYSIIKKLWTIDDGETIRDDFPRLQEVIDHINEKRDGS